MRAHALGERDRRRVTRILDGLTDVRDARGHAYDRLAQAVERLRQVRGPQTAACANFEDRLSREQVKAVPQEGKSQEMRKQVEGQTDV